MSFQSLKNELQYYLKINSDEKVNVDKILKFLAEEKNCFSRTNLKGHFTGSAWIVDNTYKWVLMTHHKKLDKWLQLGGHADENENLLEVAYNEAVEESGLSDFTIISDKIFDLDVHEIPQHGDVPTHYHYDIRYIFKTKMDPKIVVVSEESKDVAWVLKDDVFKKNDEESIKRMLVKCEKYK
tara:strand:+ start:442 stop:987 length:546 start_codon:yes stop_codon:yes gene_type:complete